MKTGDRKLSDVSDVGVDAGEICGKKYFRCNFSKCSIGGSECRLEVGSSVQNENRFIDLNPFGTSGFQVDKQSLV